MLKYREILDIPVIELPDADERFFGSMPPKTLFSAGKPAAEAVVYEWNGSPLFPVSVWDRKGNREHQAAPHRRPGRPGVILLHESKLKHKLKNCPGKWTGKGGNAKGQRRVQCYGCGAVRLTLG